MKRAYDFWVTEPFSCYFLWNERLRCHTDKVTEKARRHALKEGLYIQHWCTDAALYIAFIKVSENESEQLQDENAFGNHRRPDMITLQNTTGCYCLSIHRERKLNDTLYVYAFAVNSDTLLIS